MKPLRCYFAGHRWPDEYPYVQACFAHNSRDAKRLMWQQGGRINEECDGRYTDMRVTYQPEHDDLAQKCGVTEPCIIRDDNILRDLGWQIDGDSCCAECGKYSFDGLYPVCEHCELCSECGHMDDCPEKAKEGAQ